MNQINPGHQSPIVLIEPINLGTSANMSGPRGRRGGKVGPPSSGLARPSTRGKKIPQAVVEHEDSATDEEVESNSGNVSDATIDEPASNQHAAQQVITSRNEIQPERMDENVISLVDYIKYFDKFVKMNRWSNQRAAEMFSCMFKLGSSSASELERLDPDIQASWTAIKAAFRPDEESSRSKDICSFVNMRYNSNESAEEYIKRITKLSNRLCVEWPRMSGQQCLDDLIFIKALGMLPGELQSKVMMQDPTTAKGLVQAMHKASAWERSKPSTTEAKKQVAKHGATEGNNTKNHFTKGNDARGTKRKFNSFDQGKGNGQGSSKKPKAAKKQKIVTCYNCRTVGHYASECPKPAVNVTNANKDKKSSYLPTVNVITVPRRYIMMDINEQPTRILVDTGASTSVLPSKSFKPSKIYPTKRKVGTQADGTHLVFEGELTANICLNNLQEQHDFLIGSVAEPVLGEDCINKWNANIITGTRQIILYPGTKKELIIPYILEDEAKPRASGIDWSIWKEQVDEYFGKEYLRFNLVLAEDLVDDPVHEEVIIKTDFDEWVDANYSHVFEGIGQTSEVIHRIETENERPINEPPRRFPIGRKDKARENIQEMLTLDIIEPSHSEWHFPLVPVPKPNGDVRLAVDYRRLNAITKKDAYPMPRLDAALHKLKGSKIKSKMDLKKGYYQINLAEEDRPKTAFSFEGELYQFKRLPFGLCTAPQTFNRLMTKIFKTVKCVAFFFDDLVVISDSEEQHKKDLSLVFDLLSKYNLRVNREKSSFGQDEIVFLGHLIKQDEVRPRAAKVEAVANWPIPDCYKTLHAFLGLTNFYRNLMPQYSIIARPLYRIQKDKWIWEERHQQAFDSLKKLMTSDPVVTLPDLDKEFIVKTDACMTGVGGVLLQEIDGQRKVIEYFSKAFTDTQMNYPVIEQEATGLLWALEHWDYYLIARPFTLETDHRPLQWLQSKKEVKGKLGRMALRLQEYKLMKVVHIPGTANTDADALSRIANIKIGPRSFKRFRYFQEQEDLNLAKAIEENSNQYKLIDDTWYYVDQGKDLLIIPECHVKNVCRMVHNEQGHPSLERTLTITRARFYWPNLTKDITGWVNRCHECLVGKDYDRNKIIAPMVDTRVDFLLPFEKVAIDITGPKQRTGHPVYLVCLQDWFTKWPEVLISKTATGACITKWLEEHIIPRHTYPRVIVTDHGSQFESGEFVNFCKKYNIKHEFTAIYHHQSNGMIERFNRSLGNLIRTRQHEKGSWNTIIAKCLSAYRTAVHSTTKCTPFEMLYGRQPVLAADTVFPTRTNTMSSEAKDKREVRREEVRDEIFKASVKRKNRYDKLNATGNHEFKAGDRVYWVVDHPTNKMEDKLRGPFLVHSIENEVNIVIIGANNITRKVHCNQLRRCLDEEIPIQDVAQVKSRKPKTDKTTNFSKSLNIVNNKSV